MRRKKKEKKSGKKPRERGNNNKRENSEKEEKKRRRIYVGATSTPCHDHAQSAPPTTTILSLPTFSLITLYISTNH